MIVSEYPNKSKSYIYFLPEKKREDRPSYFKIGKADSYARIRDLEKLYDFDMKSAKVAQVDLTTTNGKRAIDIERAIHILYSASNVKHPSGLDGHTEFFQMDVFNDLMDKLPVILSNHSVEIGALEKPKKKKTTAKIKKGTQNNQIGSVLISNCDVNKIAKFIDEMHMNTDVLYCKLYNDPDGIVRNENHYILGITAFKKENWKEKSLWDLSDLVGSALDDCGGTAGHSVFSDPDSDLISISFQYYTTVDNTRIQDYLASLGFEVETVNNFGKSRDYLDKTLGEIKQGVLRDR